MILSQYYAGEVEDLRCVIKDERAFVEMRCTFTLSRSGVTKEHVIGMGSLASTDRQVRVRYLEATLEHIRGLIDDAIAEAG